MLEVVQLEKTFNVFVGYKISNVADSFVVMVTKMKLQTV